MNVLSVFSGIGGLELGLERAGMTVVGQVEIDEFCRRVLAKHWPEVPKHDDVRTCVQWWRSESRPWVDLVCGGFPCQPVSVAGQQLAQTDERWLWPEMATVIRALRPDWVLLENVPGLLGRGFGDVVGDLAAFGYDAKWDCVPAAAVGAPHLRDRLFVVAYADRDGLWIEPLTEPRSGSEAIAIDDGPQEPVAGSAGERWRSGWINGCRPESPRIELQDWPEPSRGTWWTHEPDVDRVAYGVPSRVDRCRALGNAVVPQVAEHIGRLVMATVRERVA